MLKCSRRHTYSHTTDYITPLSSINPRAVTHHTSPLAVVSCGQLSGHWSVVAVAVSDHHINHLSIRSCLRLLSSVNSFCVSRPVRFGSNRSTSNVRITCFVFLICQNNISRINVRVHRTARVCRINNGVLNVARCVRK